MNIKYLIIIVLFMCACSKQQPNLYGEVKYYQNIHYQNCDEQDFFTILEINGKLHRERSGLVPTRIGDIVKVTQYPGSCRKHIHIIEGVCTH